MKIKQSLFFIIFLISFTSYSQSNIASVSVSGYQPNTGHHINQKTIEFRYDEFDYEVDGFSLATRITSPSAVGFAVNGKLYTPSKEFEGFWNDYFTDCSTTNYLISGNLIINNNQNFPFENIDAHPASGFTGVGQIKFNKPIKIESVSFQNVKIVGVVSSSVNPYADNLTRWLNSQNDEASNDSFNTNGNSSKSDDKNSNSFINDRKSSTIDSKRMMAYKDAMEEADKARNNGDFLASSKALEKAKYYNPAGISDQELGLARASGFLDSSMDLIMRSNDTYDRFERKKRKLSIIESTNIRGIYEEFNSKRRQLEAVYENRKSESSQQIDEVVKISQNTLAENNLERTSMGVIGEIMKVSDKNQLEREKKEEIEKLRNEKDKLIDELISNLLSKVSENKEKYIEAAKYAVRKNDEEYYLKQIEFQECIIRHPKAFLLNTSYCNEPQELPNPEPTGDFTAEELYKAYLRKSNSTLLELKDFSKEYLEMAVELDPKNEIFLKEMAYNNVKSNEEKLKYFGRLVKVSPNNQQYRTDLNKAIKVDLGRKGAVGEVKNGKRDGVWTLYWANGDIQQVISYNSGVPNEIILKYYDNNMMETRIKTEVEYYREVSYNNNSIYIKQYDVQNNLIFEAVRNIAKPLSSEGKFLYYYKNFNLKGKIEYDGGKVFDSIIAYTPEIISKGCLVYCTGTITVPTGDGNFNEISIQKGKMTSIYSGAEKLKLKFKEDSLNEVGVNLKDEQIDSLTIKFASKSNLVIGFNEENAIIGFTMYNDMGRPDLEYNPDTILSNLSLDKSFIAKFDINSFLDNLKKELSSSVENKSPHVQNITQGLLGVIQAATPSATEDIPESSFVRIYGTSLDQIGPEFNQIKIDEWHNDNSIKSYSIHHTSKKNKRNYKRIKKYYFTKNNMLKEIKVFNALNGEEIKRLGKTFYNQTK